VGSYLAYQGDRFGERFDPNSYLTLTMAMDLFNLGATPAEVAEALAPTRCRWLVVSFSSDWLFPPFQSQELVTPLLAAGRPVSYCNVQTSCGHDAFLLPNEIATYGGLMEAFLENLGDWLTNGTGFQPVEGLRRQDACAAVGGPEILPHTPGADAQGATSPTSIFHHRRLDYDTILDLIPPGASVLDLGCGTGGLLARLRERGHRRIMGVELDEQAILACVRRGLDVIQTDLNQGLPALADRQFDVVVLSQTLQTVMDVQRVVRDMLRVGRRAIVSFPNLGYRKLREQLAREGRAPRATALQGSRWYDTPNVRFLSIADFQQFCRDQQIQIDQAIALDTEAACRVDDDPNLNADLAIMVLRG